jgi:hypothetical protein
MTDDSAKCRQRHHRRFCYYREVSSTFHMIVDNVRTADQTGTGRAGGDPGRNDAVAKRSHLINESSRSGIC